MVPAWTETCWSSFYIFNVFLITYNSYNWVHWLDNKVCDGQFWAPKVCLVLLSDVSCAPSPTEAHSAYYPSFLQEIQFTSASHRSLQEEIRPLVYQGLIQFITNKPACSGQAFWPIPLFREPEIYHSSSFSFSFIFFLSFFIFIPVVYSDVTQCLGTVHHI